MTSQLFLRFLFAWIAAQLVAPVFAQPTLGALDGNEAALALGASSDAGRFNAIQALMPRMKDGLSGQEMNDIAGDPKDPWRANMVQAMAPKARVGLPGNEAVLALGASSDAGRFNAIQALATKIANPLSGVEINQVAGDPNDSWRPAMIKDASDPCHHSSAKPCVNNQHRDLTQSSSWYNGSDISCASYYFHRWLF